MTVKDTEKIWTKAEVIQLEYISGEPHLYYYFSAKNNLGTKPIHISSLIRDPDLLKRVKTELASGDIVEVNSVNNERGCGTVLLGFRILKKVEGSRRLRRCIWPTAPRMAEIFRKLWAERSGNESTKED